MSKKNAKVATATQTENANAYDYAKLAKGTKVDALLKEVNWKTLESGTRVYGWVFYKAQPGGTTRRFVTDGNSFGSFEVGNYYECQGCEFYCTAKYTCTDGKSMRKHGLPTGAKTYFFGKCKPKSGAPYNVEFITGYDLKVRLGIEFASQKVKTEDGAPRKAAVKTEEDARVMAEKRTRALVKRLSEMRTALESEYNKAGLTLADVGLGLVRKVYVRETERAMTMYNEYLAHIDAVKADRLNGAAARRKEKLAKEAEQAGLTVVDISKMSPEQRAEFEALKAKYAM